jgi:hypothetical protein
LITLRDKINYVDSEFLGIVYNHSQQFESSILIIAVTCSAIVLIASTVILPFLFKLDISLLKMLEMTVNVKKEVKARMIKKGKSFDDHISNSKYLNGFLELMNENFQNDDLDIDDIKITT